MARALCSELLIAKEPHWCTENYNSVFSGTASSLRTNKIIQTNQPGSHCFTCTGICAGKATLPKGENYNSDAPLPDTDFGKRAGAFINLSITTSQSQFEASKSSLKAETTKLLFVVCISKYFLHSLFTNLTFPHWE